MILILFVDIATKMATVTIYCVIWCFVFKVQHCLSDILLAWMCYFVTMELFHYSECSEFSSFIYLFIFIFVLQKMIALCILLETKLYFTKYQCLFKIINGILDWLLYFCFVIFNFPVEQ